MASKDKKTEGKKLKKPDYPRCEADRELKNLIQARYPILYVVTYEERRVIGSLSRLCDDKDLNLTGLQVWDSSGGLTDDKGNVVVGAEQVRAPELLLQHIRNLALETKDNQAKGQRGPIFVLCDLFRYLVWQQGLTPTLERQLRSLADLLRQTSITIVVVSPVLELPAALTKCVSVVDYPLPGPSHLSTLAKWTKDALTYVGRLTEEEANEVPIEDVVRALQGLTHDEAEDALAKSVVVCGKFDVPTILDIKRQVIRKGELLDYVSPDSDMSQVGGLQGVKEFIRMRKRAFSKKAREYGLDLPRGVFLLGVQGAGKSLCAKAIASEMKFPLLKLDAGKLFGSLMGESESRCREALRMAESVAPCVLFIDEMDKALSGATGTQGDSGTSRRVVASILDWMMEKKAPVFVIGAANSIAGCPAALFRKGRFDEMFFVDLPNPDEREAIFRIHISKRGRDPSSYGISELVRRSDKYSGAEIEAAIIDAMGAAFCEDREFDTDDILRSIENTRPLSSIAKEEIDEIRESARTRGMRRAGAPYYRPDEGDDIAHRLKSL